MIQRFEDEYPETRLAWSSPKQAASISSSLGTVEGAPLSISPEDGMTSSVATLRTETSGLSNDFSDEDVAVRPSPKPSRHNSDVSLAARALSLEEGRIHRLGQNLRRDILGTPSTTPGTTDNPSQPTAGGTQAGSSAIGGSVGGIEEDPATETNLAELGKKMENMSGLELQQIVERDGWSGVMEKIGANMQELRQLQEKDPVGWEQFKESQVKARANAERRV